MFIDAFKDYVDYLDSLSALLTGPFSLLVLFKAFIFYVTKSTILAFWYIISFEWLTGFTEIPAVFQQNCSSIVHAGSIIKGKYQVNMDIGFFPLLGAGSVNSNNLGTGFMNSFFLALPISIPQLITLRTFLINGVQAGTYSALGTLVGQFLFFVCVLFGFEWILLPWLSIHPIVVLFGTVFLLNYVYHLAHKPSLLAVSNLSPKILHKFFRTNFILSWTEQICLYGYFGNLTVTGASSIFQTSEHNFLFSTFGYLLGLTVGSLFWTAAWCLLLMAVRNFIFNNVLLEWSTLDLTKEVHKFTAAVIVVLAMSSFPYYGFEYLVGSPMGHVSEDIALRDTQTDVYYEVEHIFGYPNKEEDDYIDDMYTFFLEPGKGRTPTSMEYDVESYNIPSENRWRNHIPERNRITEEALIKIFEVADPDLEHIYVPEYESPRLKYAEQKFDKTMSRPFIRIMEQFARPDVYSGYTDSRDDEYSDETQLHRQFREKFYSNPVYKALLKMDMYPFLSGENPHHKLSVDDEYDLFTRRLYLNAYVRSIQKYKKAKYPNATPFSNRVYNQQFKGSLNVIRQFNFAKVYEAMEPDEDSDDYYKRQRNKRFDQLKVLRYDQALFNETLAPAKQGRHEQLKQPKSKKKKLKKKLNSYLRPYDTSGFYIGWDGNLRKFLVKQRVHLAEMRSPIYYAEPNGYSAADDPNNQMAPGQIETKNKQGKPKREPKYEIPTSYSFQAWSPASKTRKKVYNKKFNLPGLSVTKRQKEEMKLALDLIDLSYKKTEEDTNEYTEYTRAEVREIDDIFSRLPNYDWYWLKMDDDFELQGYLDLANTAPPKLDGYAWPGQKDPIYKPEPIIRREIDEEALKQSDIVLKDSVKYEMEQARKRKQRLIRIEKAKRKKEKEQQEKEQQEKEQQEKTK